jgi:small subunit ribosomal protein S13
MCLILGYDCRIKLDDLRKNDFERLDFLIRQRVFIDKALKFLVEKNIGRSLRTKSYVGKRHSQGLPVRGQRTRSNGSTAKRLCFYKKPLSTNVKTKKK